MFQSCSLEVGKGKTKTLVRLSALHLELMGRNLHVRRASVGSEATLALWKVLFGMMHLLNA